MAYLLSGRQAGTVGGDPPLVGARRLSIRALREPRSGGRARELVRPEGSLAQPDAGGGRSRLGGNGYYRGNRGPPLALIYQSHSGPQIRATLAVAFSVGTVLSLAALVLADRVGADHLLLALKLLPALLLGLGTARFVAELFTGRWLRPAILLFAALSGLAAVLLGVAG